MQFTQNQYTDSEYTGFVLVTLELVGGTSSKSFYVTVTPLEQSPVFAQGNSVCVCGVCVCVCCFPR